MKKIYVSVKGVDYYLTKKQIKKNIKKGKNLKLVKMVDENTEAPVVYAVSKKYGIVGQVVAGSLFFGKKQSGHELVDLIDEKIKGKIKKVNKRGVVLELKKKSLHLERVQETQAAEPEEPEEAVFEEPEEQVVVTQEELEETVEEVVEEATEELEEESEEPEEVLEEAEIELPEPVFDFPVPMPEEPAEEPEEPEEAPEGAEEEPEEPAEEAPEEAEEEPVEESEEESEEPAEEEVEEDEEELVKETSVEKLDKFMDEQKRSLLEDLAKLERMTGGLNTGSEIEKAADEIASKEANPEKAQVDEETPAEDKKKKKRFWFF